MIKLQKQAIVVHSGGMDSSICLALAIQKHGAAHVLSMSFSYNQRNSKEIMQAAKIAHEWQVDHITLSIDCLQEITHNALLDPLEPIQHRPGAAPNTLVVGRNGLMARLAAIHAEHLGASYIYMGVLELEEANSGYRDCNRAYMDLIQAALRIDLSNPRFEICTPLIYMTKMQTLELAHQLGVLEFLLRESITCYENIPHLGCQVCPACQLRNRGIKDFLQVYPDFSMPYSYY